MYTKRLSKTPKAFARAFLGGFVDSPTIFPPSTEVDESGFLSERFIILNHQWTEPEIRFGEELGIS
jgi:hypothetical protein